MKPVMTYFPEPRLLKLAQRFSGISREEAIEKAKECIASMRGEGDEAIIRLMADVETLLGQARDGRLPAEEMKALLRSADQLVTLAGTFGYAALERVMKCLCDVTDGLIRAGRQDAAPIIVHVRAMRLLTPGSSVLTPEHIEMMLAELAKILTHYDFSPIGAQAGTPDEASNTTL